MKLSNYINLILELENSDVLSEDESFSIDGFDRAILILDDIEDRSQIRDGKPCFYITNGIPNAKKEAEKLNRGVFITFDKICKQRKIGIIKSFYAKFLLKKLHRNIKIGQQIDKQLQSSQYNHNLLLKYDRMVLLFTGGHIKYAFLIGFLLSVKNPSYKNQVVYIGEQIGVLRQIDDDIKDYEGYHHEALGDLIQHKNRLPELLFQMYATSNEKTKLDDLLVNHSSNQSEIKNLIFNDKVKEHLNEKVNGVIVRINLKINILPENYKSQLSQLMSNFLE